MRILNVAGARPNFMKIAPLMREMSARPGVDASVIHTGQHYDESMSQIFFEDLGIPKPLLNLGVGSGSRERQIECIMARFEPVVREHAPDLVVVVGDVNSTIACARVARAHDVAVAHVEAGLRSFDETMPEELNRVATDQISDLLFVTEQSGMDNLAAEGVPGQAYLVGNVMIDSLVSHLPRAEALAQHRRFGLEPGQYFVATFHRPSNVDSRDKLENVCRIVSHAARDHVLVWPLHPRTRKSLEQHGLLASVVEQPNVRVCEPLGYLEFLSLVRSAKGVVTDSGGIQEETTWLQIPCVTMRDNTERPVTVALGSNVLAGTDPNAVMAAVDDIRSGRFKRGEVPPLWDGKAAARIVDVLGANLGVS